MTFTIKDAKVGNFYIETYQEKNSVLYHVGWYVETSNGLYRTLDDRTYTTLGGADRRFRTLVKRCEKG